MIRPENGTHPLKAKYRNPSGKWVRRTAIDPPEGTWVCAVGLSSKRSRTGGNSGSGSKVVPIRARMKAYWGNVLR